MFADFSGKKIFITGASRGIGKTICHSFIKQGADVIAPTRQELDLSDRNSVERYIASADRLPVDIFIHCAGLNMLAGIKEINSSILDKVFQVNCFSSVELIKAFAPGMRDKKWGRIIFISSLYALVSKENRIAYSSSKTALTGLMKTLALELAPDNILVNAVAPGYVMTDMTRQNLNDEDIKRIQENIPTGRFQSEQDIANLVAFLCSEYNQSITGQLVAVDGGFTCR